MKRIIAFLILTLFLLIVPSNISKGQNAPFFSNPKNEQDLIHTKLISTNLYHDNDDKIKNIFLDSNLEGSFEINDPTYFILGFEREIYVDKILIYIENRSNLSIQYTVDDVDFYGTKIKGISEQSSNGDNLIKIDLKNSNSAYIKLSLNILDSQINRTGLKLKKVKVYGKPTSPIEEAIFLNNQGDFLSNSDPSNPLKIFRAPIEKSTYILSNKIIENNKDLTDHEKVMKYIDYMKNYKIGFASNALAPNTVREKIGQCGSFTNTLIAFAKAQGIDGRIIYMMNYPENAGHTVAELWINGKWNMYDPTYGVYYTTTPNDKKAPKVLSFNELKNGEGKKSNVVRIVTNKKRLDEPNSYKFIEPEIYEKSNPSGVIGPDSPFTFPLTMDINTMKIIKKEDFSLKNQGADYIGVASVNNNQSWKFTSLEVGKTYKFVITPSWLGGEKGLESEFDIEVNELSGMVLLGDRDKTYYKGDMENNPWEIYFVAKSETAELLISHPYKGPKYHYLMVDKYELFRAGEN